MSCLPALMTRMRSLWTAGAWLVQLEHSGPGKLLPRVVSCCLLITPTGEVTHPRIQALVLDDISVLLAKFKRDLAAKKDSSQNSCLDPTAFRKLFLPNFLVPAQKTFYWRNTCTSLEQRQGPTSQLHTH